MQSLALIAKQIGRCKEITMRLLALRRPRCRLTGEFNPSYTPATLPPLWERLPAAIE